MFKKIRIKITLLTTLFIFSFIVFLVTSINIMNYQQLLVEADTTINDILNKEIKDLNENSSFEITDEDDKPLKKPDRSPFDTHFFSLIISNTDNNLSYEISSNEEISDKQALIYGYQAHISNKQKGFIDHFRFRIETIDDTSIIVFVDCSRTLGLFREFLISSIIILVIGLLFIFFILLFFSRKMIKPFEENYIKQRRFITNAGHEIKTPLTIINTNVDILELEYGTNDSLDDIKKQVNYLKNFTNQLLLLSKMEESYNVTLTSIPISDIITEEIISFSKYAESNQKKIIYNIEPLLSIEGNDKLIRQLTSILLDNSVKYSPINSSIQIDLYKQNNTIIYTISNESIYQIDDKHLNDVFDRFYRIDESHNSNISGHGIGLSIAKAIINSHKAKINASSINNQFVITITFNIKKTTNFD